MKYNLDGQKGPKGEINPDNLAAGPYIYDTPPGQGDNKGLTGDKKPVDPEQHKTKQTGEPLKGNAFEVIKDSINNLNDISDNPIIKSLNLTSSQKLNLGNKLGVSSTDIKKAQQGPIIGQRRNPFRLGEGLDPISQLQFETDFIKNYVQIRKENKKSTVDTRTLEQKETDYIKHYVATGELLPVDFKEENITMADLSGDINYVEQLNNESNKIKEFIDNKVDNSGDKNDDEIVEDVVGESSTSSSADDSGQIGGTGGTGGTGVGSGQITNTAFTQFNNIPEDGLLWNVGGNFYIVYEVPGSQGELYEGNPIYMAYELKDNDLVNAGLLTKGETAPQPNATMDQAFFDSIAIVTGNTDQLSSLIDNPFASFVETVGEQSQVAPWITDPEMISLIAEAAVEGREVTDAEWQTTNWYQTHNEGEREWLRTYYSDPSTATQLTTDAQIAVANSLQAAGVSNAPESMINWVAGKYVSGEWSQTYTTEQINLFADPYATGKRDVQFENYLSSTALTGVDRTTEREREVRELYNKWLGPSLGKLTDNETAEIAGRLRDDPDYQDQLVNSLKQSRLAAFSNYTNPELTYEDIARPWRNLTTSVWGQTADETQGWWQEMVKSNDFAKAQTTLREKGLEQDVTQVTQDATQALQQALGQGSVSQTGVNV
jgi:hypothetical protein